MALKPGTTGDPEWLIIARSKGMVEREEPHVLKVEKVERGANQETGLPPMSEADFQKIVIALARSRGWLVCHFRTSRNVRKDGTVHYETAVQGDGAGFPDLVLVRDRLVLVELKADGGRLREEQHRWLEALGKANVEHHVWRPSQMAEIEGVLK
jgi:hypothetical protein